MRLRTCSLALLVAVLAVAAVPPTASAASPVARTVDSIAPSASIVTYELHRMHSVTAIRIDSLVIERVTSLRGVTTRGALTTTPTRALAQPASAINRGTESTMTTMRAKMHVTQVEQFGTPVTQERVSFSAVGKSTGYTGEGLDEDNTYARYSPSGSLQLTIANPALLGKLAVGEKYYLDFTPADQPSTLDALRETVAGDSAASG